MTEPNNQTQPQSDLNTSEVLERLEHQLRLMQMVVDPNAEDCHICHTVSHGLDIALDLTKMLSQKLL